VTAESRRHPFAAGYLFGGACAAAIPTVAMVADMPNARYPMAVVSVVVFFAATATRTSMEHFGPLISPQTIAVSVWGLLLVVFPIALNYFPAVLGQLPALPPDRTVNLAMLLNVVAFLSFMVGYHLRLARPSKPAPSDGAALANLNPLIGSFAVAGVLGIVIRFGSVDAFTSYLQGTGLTYRFEQLAGLRAVLATILPPFLSFSFVMMLQRWRLKKQLTVPRVIVAGAGVVAPLVLYSYNRAAVVIPLVGLVGVLGHLGGRRRTGMLAIFVVAMALGSYQAGSIRSQITATEGGRFSLAEVGIDPTNGPSWWETLSMYGQSPQLTAFALTVPLRQDFPGQPLISSLLSPVPGLGKHFRDSTGTAAYNLAIYGTPKIVDQIMPLTAESWGSLGPLGTVSLFCAIGALVGHAHQRFLTRQSLIKSYICMVLGTWFSLASIVSLLVLAQIFVYFLWPHLTFVLIESVRKSWMTGAAPYVREDSNEKGMVRGG